MKKYLVLLVFSFMSFSIKAQTSDTPGPIEQKMTDSLCNCMTNIDLSKITTKEEANAAFTECFSKHSEMILEVAQERKVDVTDQEGMHNVGIEIGKNLLRQNCNAFLSLSTKMAGESKNDEESTSGTFKRIDNKGFNYLVISDNNGNEKSFIWLRQFSGSEKFMNGIAKYAGKKVKIKWQEIEVYLPLAKGYYKVKEITGIDIL